ncbi:MAG: flavin reductase family protein [Rhodobacteraceae bacterium]|jgi:flavin reductase (DIM6/NTAB) family NADH-FMN oxidoreductase RutF|nr:flavin reductase family protein [Paracoccaceae bacterium]MCZ8084347.1 flavin reductase family protein [Paracoccaceae bacterium]
MNFDFTVLAEDDRYRLLTNFVGPRPIALVSTVDEQGRNNAAPMSFFNVFSHEPPILILGVQPREDGAPKDTVANLRRSGEFVVHMVDMAIAQAMLVTGRDVPPGVDEIALAGLTAVPSIQVAAPRIAESACAMECRVEQIIDYPRRAIILGRVVQMYVRDECLDAAGRYVDPATYQPIARLHMDNYVTSDRQIVLEDRNEP